MVFMPDAKTGIAPTLQAHLVGRLEIVHRLYTDTFTRCAVCHTTGTGIVTRRSGAGPDRHLLARSLVASLTHPRSCARRYRPNSVHSVSTDICYPCSPICNCKMCCGMRPPNSMSDASRLTPHALLIPTCITIIDCLVLSGLRTGACSAGIHVQTVLWSPE